MTGWKDWQIGEVVTESDFQNLVQDQVVQRYADAATRTSTLGTAIAEGMVSYLEDTNSFEVYDGSAWVGLAGGFTVSDTAPTAPSEGDTWYNSTNGNLYTYYDSYWVETSAPAQNISAVAVTAPITNSGTSTNAVIGIDENALVGRNYIINGAFDVWQRGTSFSSVANAAYTADRFQFTRSGTGNTISQQTFSAGELEAASFGGSSYYLRLYTDGTDTAPRIGQLIEDVRTLAGQTVTLSFWAKSDVSDVLQTTSFVLQNFGSGGSAQVGTSFTLPAVTTSWQRYSVSINIPSISGKTIGPNNNLQIQLRPKASTEFTLDIWGVQLEAGSVATPFKRHAPSLQGELAACQRYYLEFDPASNTAVGFGYMFSSTSFRGALITPVEMRTTPTLTVTSNFGIASNGSNITPTSLSVEKYPAQLNVIATITGGTTLEVGAYRTAEKIIMDAEL